MHSLLLSALAIGISIILLVWLRKAETLLLSMPARNRRRGGNVIDRVLWGHVFDFLIFTLPVIIFLQYRGFAITTASHSS